MYTHVDMVALVGNQVTLIKSQVMPCTVILKICCIKSE